MPAGQEPDERIGGPAGDSRTGRLRGSEQHHDTSRGYRPSSRKDEPANGRYFNYNKFERVWAMLELKIVVVGAGLVIYVGVYAARRAKGRVDADRIIAGQRTATEKQINKCIARIHGANNWLVGRSEADLERIGRLYNMRKEMVTPHG